MLQTFRNYPVIGLLIMGGLVIVFAISGIFSSGGQSQGPGIVGTVNGDPITTTEFRRSYERRVQMFKMYGMKDEQIRQMRLGDGVWDELVTKKLTIELTEKLGMTPTDAEILEYIKTKYPVFQKDGKFDAERYKQVLAGNNFTPADFEKMLREELQAADWQAYFNPSAIVTATEVQWEHEMMGNRRKFRYVMVPTDVAKKLKPEQIEAVRKELSARASDAKIEALLKEHKIKAVTTDWVAAKADVIPGVGESEAVVRDGFAGTSPIDLKSGGAAKKYDMVRGTLLAAVVEAERPSATISDADRLQLVQDLSSRKERDLSSRVLQGLRASAKQKKNAAVLKSFEG